MKNIDNWQLANRLSAIGMIAIAIFNSIVFYLASFIEFMNNKYLFLIVLIVEFVGLYYIVEKKLAKNETK